MINYSWTPATGLSATNISNPVASPSATTTYSVTATDANGCTRTDQVTVKVGTSTVNAVIEQNGQSSVTICKGQSVNFATFGSPGPDLTSFYWTPTSGLDDPYRPDPVATPTQTTTYTVVATDANGCPSSASVTVHVDENNIDAGADQTVCMSAGILNLSGYGPQGGQWSGNGIKENGIFDPQDAGLGTHTLTYTVVNSCGTFTDIKYITVTRPNEEGYCCDHQYVNNSQDLPSATLGKPQDVTVIDANGGTIVFDGQYHVVGTLHLTNGNFEMRPGTTLYFEGDGAADGCITSDLESALSQDRTGNEIFLVISNKADVTISGTRLTAACDYMWGGVILSDNSSLIMDKGRTQQDREVVSEISDALIGLYVSDDIAYNCDEEGYVTANCHYNIAHTELVNNYISVYEDYDGGFANSSAPTIPLFANTRHINNSHISFRAVSVKKPLAGLYQQLNFSGFYLAGNYLNCTFTHNTFDDMYQGINASGENVHINQNLFRNNDRAVSTITRTSLIEENRMLNTGYCGVCTFNNETDNYQDQIKNNTMSGGSGYGVYNFLTKETVIENNTIENMTQGVRVMHFLDGAPSMVQGNMLRNNSIGVAMAKNYLAAPSPQLEISCNSIIDSDQGIVAETDAWLNNLGTPTDPAGNSFTNVSQPVVNDGGSVSGNTNFEYFAYDTPLEGGAIPANIPGAGVLSISTSLQANPIGACHQRLNNYGNNNGINTLRVRGNSYADILQMMDSLLYQVGSPADFRYYVNHILKYHRQQNQLSSLHPYLQQLDVQHHEAFNMLGLNLMELYRKEGLENEAQQLKNLLLSKSAGDAEVEYRALYFDVIKRLGKNIFRPGRRLAAQDSTDLQAIALSGTTMWEPACYILSYYYRNSSCSGPVSAASRMAQPNQAKAVLEAAIEAYPNP
ncbi:MAG: hypothetical protein LPK01_16015, partial [Hymenobacteraceae bacterium]|nr:hypothetical protein [Hymenobacteraceae bacterium]